MSSTSFEEVVKQLLSTVLKEDFEVAAFDVILACVPGDDFEVADIKFSNGQRIGSPTDIFKAVLFTRVTHSLFAYYLQLRSKIELSDEPEDCSGFIAFRDRVCNFAWFRSTFQAYFDCVIVPVFNSRISNRLISLFGDEL